MKVSKDCKGSSDACSEEMVEKRRAKSRPLVIGGFFHCAAKFSKIIMHGQQLPNEYK
jgi:hypothetical protein